MDTKRFETRLRTERREIAEALAAVAERLASPQGESGGELTLADQHPADAATETTQRELDLTHKRRFEQKLARTDAAIERIAKGTYGRCAVCGQAIPDERLEIVPATSYCVKDAAHEREDR